MPKFGVSTAIGIDRQVILIYHMLTHGRILE